MESRCLIAQTRVLHVISGLALGGAERMLVEIAKGLQRRGLAQHVISLRGRGDYAEDLEQTGIPVSAVDITLSPQTLPALWQLRRVVQGFQPSVLQGWMYHGDLAALGLHRLAGGRARRRLFWSLRASNVEDARYARVIRACARLSRLPDVVVANSAAGAAFHAAQGYRPRRLEIIHNGIDTERFRPDPQARSAVRAELGIGADAVIALHVARVDPMKDHATFTAAMGKLPNVTALLAGAGTESLMTPPHVRAIGPVRSIERVCAAADLIVSSSAYGEGFSNSLAEGMSCGLIPIATDVGDARVIVGDTGHIIRPRDAEGLAAAIGAEARLPHAERRSRGDRARRRIESEFTIDKAIDAFARLYAPSSPTG